MTVTYLVSQGEATHLRVVLEPFNTDGSSTARDLHPCNDAITPLRVRRRCLALSASALLKLVQ